MAEVTFVDALGSSRRVQIRDGISLMEGGVLGGVPGIDADCGGARLCATCQVIIDPAWIDRLPPKEEGEATLLEMAYDPQPGSRLSCFIRASASLDGLVVRVPPAQR